MVLFLGIACIIGGVVCVLPLFMERNPGLKRFDDRLTTYKIIIGIAVLVIGIIKFIVPYHRNGRVLIPIFGDFFPAVLAILTGIFVSIDFLESIEGIKGAFLERLRAILQKYQFPIGFAAILFGILHWIVFRVVFF